MNKLIDWMSNYGLIFIPAGLIGVLMLFLIIPLMHDSFIIMAEIDETLYDLWADDTCEDLKKEIDSYEKYWSKSANKAVYQHYEERC